MTGKYIEASLSDADEPQDFETALEIGMMVLRVLDVLRQKNEEEQASGTALFCFKIGDEKVGGTVTFNPGA